MRWRLIAREELPPARNMAVDEAIFLRHQRTGFDATLRFYGWSVPTLSIGHGQDYASAVNEDSCKAQGIAVVRRPTGGWAVLHDDELTYCVVSSSESDSFRGCGAKEIYGRISEAFIVGLKALGAEAIQNKLPAKCQNPALTRTPCFQISSYCEVIAPDGRKIVGSAQKRTREAFLQHGSVPITLDKKVLYEITRFDDSSEDANFAALSEIISQKISREDIADALRRAFEEVFKIKFVSAPLTEEEISLARQLETEKYQTDEWTKHARKQSSRNIER